MKVTLGHQLEAFSKGIYLDSDGTEGGCFNFYDWSCRGESLKGKANKLFPMVRRFAKKMNIDLSKHYVFFKNNAPCTGSLYDDFRICDIKSGEVVWTVIPKSGHSFMCEVWGAENEFKTPIFKGKNLSEFYKTLTN